MFWRSSVEVEVENGRGTASVVEIVDEAETVEVEDEVLQVDVGSEEEEPTGILVIPSCFA